MNIKETLSRCELFLGLDDSDIQKIVDLPSCTAKNYSDQEVIFKGGEGAKHLYIVKEGKVSLILRLPDSVAGEARQAVWRTVTRGGIFGWSSLVPPHFRIGSVVSDGPSTAVSIDGEELWALFDRDTRLGYEVMKSLVRVIASRVWNIEKLLATGYRSPFV